MATIVTRASKGSALTHAEIDANFNNLNSDTEQFASGTALIFFQAAAPTGWTQDVTNTDSMLRIVSTAGGGVGGSDSPITGLTITDNHVLTVAEMPAHQHTINEAFFATAFAAQASQGATTSSPQLSSSTGGGGGHTHDITYAPKYVDVIHCTKN